MSQNDGNIVKRTSQYIDNLSFDEATGLQMAEVAGTDGSGNIYRAQVDSTGALKVSGGSSISNAISSGNSTTTPLGANATFVGAWEDVSTYSTIVITGYVDQNSASNGAIIEFSDDGSTVIRQSFSTITAPNFGFPAVTPVEARYFRLIYTNGPTPQTVCHVQTIYHATSVSAVQLPLGAAVTENDMAGLSRAVLAGVNGTSVANIAVTSSNNLGVAISEATAPLPIAALSHLVTKQIPVGTTAAQLSSSVTGRKSVSIRALLSNTGNIYLGTTNAVTTGNGYELGAGESIDLEVDETQPLWLIASAASQTVCVAEVY